VIQPSDDEQISAYAFKAPFGRFAKPGISSKIRKTARELVPLPPHERARRIERPEDGAARRLKKFFTLLVAAPEVAKQIGDSRDHRAGEHPRRNLATASWHERQLKELWSGMPARFGQHATDAGPAESRTYDDATYDLAGVS
jgi:hypothetical protein